MGPGMMGQGWGPGQAGDITPDDVRQLLQRRIAMMGNDRLKVGDIKEEDGRITADIVTNDGSLVDRFGIDTQTGAFTRLP